MGRDRSWFAPDPDDSRKSRLTARGFVGIAIISVLALGGIEFAEKVGLIDEPIAAPAPTSSPRPPPASYKPPFSESSARSQVGALLQQRFGTDRRMEWVASVEVLYPVGDVPTKGADRWTGPEIELLTWFYLGDRTYQRLALSICKSLWDEKFQTLSPEVIMIFGNNRAHVGVSPGEIPDGYYYDVMAGGVLRSFDGGCQIDDQPLAFGH